MVGRLGKWKAVGRTKSIGLRISQVVAKVAATPKRLPECRSCPASTLPWTEPDFRARGPRDRTPPEGYLSRAGPPEWGSRARGEGRPQAAYCLAATSIASLRGYPSSCVEFSGA